MILEDKVLDVIEGKANIRTGEPLPALDETSKTKETTAAAASSQKEETETAGDESTQKGR
jgi:hypothetical protein